jgi:hypothetical protein
MKDFDLGIVEVITRKNTVFTVDPKQGHGNEQGASEMESVILSEVEIVRHEAAPVFGGDRSPLDRRPSGPVRTAITAMAKPRAAARFA